MSALAAGARRVLPPLVDSYTARFVRGVMFEQIAHDAGVTLTGSARRALVELDPPSSVHGIAGRTVRWVAGRVLPGSGMIDFARVWLRTVAGGSLFERYVRAHRDAALGLVVDEIEATRVRDAILGALDPFSRIDSLPAIASRARTEGVRALPRAWIDAMELAAFPTTGT